MCKHCDNEAPGYDTTCTNCIHRLCMTAKTWEHYKNLVYAIAQSYSTHIRQFKAKPCIVATPWS